MRVHLVQSRLNDKNIQNIIFMIYIMALILFLDYVERVILYLCNIV
nr:MAG TPA: hypothetical protein [Bacteriophage sp.]